MSCAMTNDDNPATVDPTKVAIVEFDLEDLERLNRESSPFARAISQAATDAEKESFQTDQKRIAREALAVAEREVKAALAKVQADYGIAIGLGKLWTYRAKPKAAYELWKRVIPMFVQRPETLKIGPTALAELLDQSEPNFAVTRDMMYASLNPIAVKEAGRLLSNLGVSITIKKPASIRSIQKQLVESRDLNVGATVEEFYGNFRIRDDIAHVNGRPYQIQRGASGRRRIKIDGRHWLSLDTVKAFCTIKDPIPS